MFFNDKKNKPVEIARRQPRKMGQGSVRRMVACLGGGLFFLVALGMGSASLVPLWASETTETTQATNTNTADLKKESDVSQEKEGAGHQSLVRLPMLPNRAVSSHFVEKKRPRVESKEKKDEAKKAEQAKPDAAALAAYTAYKKKQLEALESDRKTLEALQAAIQDLGLSQKLSFTGGSFSGKTPDGAKQPAATPKKP